MMILIKILKDSANLTTQWVHKLFVYVLFVRRLDNACFVSLLLRLHFAKTHLIPLRSGMGSYTFYIPSSATLIHKRSHQWIRILMKYLTSGCFYSVISFFFYLLLLSRVTQISHISLIKTTSILRYAGILCDPRLPIMPQHTTIYWMRSNSKYIKVRGKKSMPLRIDAVRQLI